MARRITVVPAYGRDYRSKKEVEEAWNAGKDFLIQDMSSPWDGSYINKEDAERGGIREVNVRFKRLRNVHVIRVAADLGGWETGMVNTEEGVWDTGEVISREEDGGGEVEIGDGSQVPPARDDYGNELDEDGEPLESSIPRVAAHPGEREIRQVEKILGDAYDDLGKAIRILFKMNTTIAGQVNSAQEQIGGALDAVADYKAAQGIRAASGWEALERRVGKAHSRVAGWWSANPLGGDDPLDLMAKIEQDADTGAQAAALIQGELRKGSDDAYGAMGVWDFLVTKGPVDWRKDLARLKGDVSKAASRLIHEDWAMRWNNPDEPIDWLLLYEKGRASGKLKYDFKQERWAFVDAKTKVKPELVLIKIEKGELNTGRTDIDEFSFGINTGTGDVNHGRAGY
jgi:hypothetical protein